MSRPGELVYVEIKNSGGSPKAVAGGRTAGRPGPTTDSKKVGYAFVHSAVDSYTRLAYSEVLTDEQASPQLPSGLTPS